MSVNSFEEQCEQYLPQIWPSLGISAGLNQMTTITVVSGLTIEINKPPVPYKFLWISIHSIPSNSNLDSVRLLKSGTGSGISLASMQNATCCQFFGVCSNDTKTVLSGIGVVAQGPFGVTYTFDATDSFDVAFSYSVPVSLSVTAGTEITMFYM